MDIAGSFTWEGMPTRDADSGQLTAAGWIPLIKTYTKRAAIMIIVFHTAQSSIRIATKHEMMYIAWYPFDWSISPFYELVIFSQVKITIINFERVHPSVLIFTIILHIKQSSNTTCSIYLITSDI